MPNSKRPNLKISDILQSKEFSDALFHAGVIDHAGAKAGFLVQADKTLNSFTFTIPGKYEPFFSEIDEAKYTHEQRKNGSDGIGLYGDPDAPIIMTVALGFDMPRFSMIPHINNDKLFNYAAASNTENKDFYIVPVLCLAKPSPRYPLQKFKLFLLQEKEEECWLDSEDIMNEIKQRYCEELDKLPSRFLIHYIVHGPPFKSKNRAKEFFEETGLFNAEIIDISDSNLLKKARQAREEFSYNPIKPSEIHYRIGRKDLEKIQKFDDYLFRQR